jgi:hypothetical protein
MIHLSWSTLIVERSESASKSESLRNVRGRILEPAALA